uniref:NADH-ubiquinone oxidoreductase chain 2 n=1 Tax=Nilaparvata lugens TaxID=108931 RepID=A0A3T1DFZ6_NILLU|nr:NADH dehydrogenase subunit 2 [Nilaparvata lugens]
MKLNMSKMIFISMIFVSSFISLSMNNWFSMWIIMEISLFMFIPLMSKNKISDQSMKYFIIQSISSYLFIFSIIINSMNEMYINNPLTLLSLMLKIGMPPFHIWKPEIMSKLPWMECLLLTTLIKIPPMILINKLISFKMLMIPLLITLIIGSLSGLNQLNLKKMMAFSSIFNLPWMSSAFLISKKIMLTFLIFYIMLNFKLMNLFKLNNLNYLNQLNFLPLKTKMTMNLNMLSLSGLPPLLGFFPKWMILNELIKTLMILPSIMILTSMISMFMYIQINSFCMNNFSFKKKNFKNNTAKSFSILNLMVFPMMLIFWM